MSLPKRVKRLLLVGGLLIVAETLALDWIMSQPTEVQPRLAVREKQRRFPAPTKRILEQADTFILLSLEPHRRSNSDPPAPPTQEKLRGYNVLGSTEIRDARERSELLQALYRGVEAAGDDLAMCFNPRHGIRATSSHGTIELVICFECGGIQLHQRHPSFVPMNDSPKKVFNRILEREHIPIEGKTWFNGIFLPGGLK